MLYLLFCQSIEINGYDKILKGNLQMAESAFLTKILGCIYVINGGCLSIDSLRAVKRSVCVSLLVYQGYV